jgi:hypothetical protein
LFTLIRQGALQSDGGRLDGGRRGKAGGKPAKAQQQVSS